MEERLKYECDDKLIHILKSLRNHVIDVIVAGGWLFTGKLFAVEEDLLVLCDATVTSSGGLTLSTFEVERVAICLEAVTSAGKPVLLT